MTDSKYKLQEFVAHSTRVNCLCFGPKSNQVLATGGEDWKVNIWRVGSVTNIWTLGQNKSPIECLCFDSDEQCVVSGTKSGALKVFDLNVGKLARSLGSHPVTVTSVQYHPYGEFVVSGSVDCTMKVWDVRQKNCIQTYNGHSKELTCVRFSPDGKWVASAAKDGQLQFWDLIAGKLVNSIKLQPTTVKSFEFSPADFTVAAATSMRTVKFWDLETMDVIGTTTSEPTTVQGMAYSSLGTELYVASKDTLRMWDLEPSLTLRSTVETGWEKVDDMKISNNYQLVAGSCMSNFVSVWSIDIQEQMEQAAVQQEELASPDVNRDRHSGKYSAVGAKAVEPPPAQQQVSRGGGGQAQQLNDVRRQLSQLSSDLGFGDRGSSACAQDKGVSPTYAGAGDPGSAPGSRVTSHRYAAAEAKSAAPGRDHYEDADLDEKPYSARGRYGTAAEAKSTPEEVLAAAQGKAVPAEVSDGDVSPQVVWEGGHSQSQEMATSMGESFWNRFKQSQQQKKDRGDDKEVDDEVPSGSGDNEYEEDSDFIEEEDPLGDSGHEGEGDIEYEIRKRLALKEEVGVTNEELEDLLPPPSFGDDGRGFGAGAGVRGGRVGGGPSSGGVGAPVVGPRSAGVAGGVGGGVGGRAIGAAPVAAGRPTVNGPRSGGPSAAGAPVVRSSPLAIVGDAVSEDYAPSAGNQLRKAQTPSFARPPGVRLPTPSGLGGGKTPSDVEPNAGRGAAVGGGGGMEVVGMRHLRSPTSAAMASNPSRGVITGPGSGVGTGAPANGNGAGGGNGDADAKKAADLLESLLGDSLPSRTALTQRLQSLKLLRMLWGRGEVNDCIDHLAVLSEALSHSPGGLATLADFFDAVELRGNGLNLDSCVRLLPILDSMVASGPGYASEHVMYATFKSLSNLAEGFGDLIRNTRATIVIAGGVDLTREARLNKCNACHSIFSRLAGRVEQLRRQFRASRTTVDILDVYADLCGKYFQ